MSSNENLLSLSLSDIMHLMSPSPVPVEDQLPSDDHQPRYEPDAQQEALTDSEILIIRNRLQELGLVMPYGSENEELAIPRLDVASHLNLREKELTHMILRLTGCPRTDPNQLQEQATMISILSTQRDRLISEAQEQQLRLESERENWNRTAEALLTQKTRSLKTEDMDAQRAAYEAEIKSLREKLHDRHRRLAILEQEIIRLKPLLLMQPYSNQRVKQTLAMQSQTTRVQEKGKRPDADVTPSKTTSLNINSVETPRKFDPTAYPYGYQYKPEVSTPSGQSSNSHTFLLEGAPVPGPGSQRRRSKDHSTTQKGKKQRHHRSTTVASDAYAEHVLLAAQRIGRKRAAHVTGLQRLADHEKEVLAHDHEQLLSRKEQERLEQERLNRLASGTPSMAYYRPTEDSGPRRGSGSTPTSSKTPIRGGNLFGQHHNAKAGGMNTPPPSTYVFVNTSATRMSKQPTTYSPGANLKTPSRTETTLNSSPTMRLSQSSNPPTPLDSLADAARMVGESGDRSNGRRRPHEEPDSPTVKRRKVSTDKVLVNRGTSKLGRVKSGLDVLAEQAAAVKKPGQTSAHSSGNISRMISDRKGKGKANSQVTDTEWSMLPKSRISTRTARPPSRRLFVSPRDGLPSTSSPIGTITRHAVTPEPRVIALPTVASTGFDSSGVARVGVNLRPVSGWGDRPSPDEDSDSDSSCNSPTGDGLRTEKSRIGFPSIGDQNTLDVNNPQSATRPERERGPAVLGDSSDAAPVNEYGEERSIWTRTPTHQHADDTEDVTSQALAQSSIRQTLATDISEESPLAVLQPVPQTTPQASRQSSFAPLPADRRESEESAADAAGSDEDEDAEGEEDEENAANEAELGSKYHSSRSRSPPPPDPPGNNNGPGPNNERDPDADADGDMDVDDKGMPPSGTSPFTHQTRSCHHRQTATFVIEISIPIKPIPKFLIVSPRQPSSCVQHSRASIHTIVCDVGKCAASQTSQSHRGVERDDSICDPVGYRPISKSASIVCH